MMIVMKEGATEAQISAVVRRVETVGADAHLSRGEFVTVIGAIGDREQVANLGLEGADGVDHLVPILKPYKLASLQYRRVGRTVVEVDGRRIGADNFATTRGLHGRVARVLLDTARTVATRGAQLRGGPTSLAPLRTPYRAGEAGWPAGRAKEETGLRS